MSMSPAISCWLLCPRDLEHLPDPRGGWAEQGMGLARPSGLLCCCAFWLWLQRPSFWSAPFQVLLLIPSLSSQRTLISWADLSI